MLRTMWRKQARIRCFPREKQGFRVVETRNPCCSKGLHPKPASEHLADPRKSRVFVPGAQHRLAPDGDIQGDLQAGRGEAEAVVASLVAPLELQSDRTGRGILGKPDPRGELDLPFVESDLLGAERVEDLGLSGGIGDMDQRRRWPGPRVEAER